MIDYIGGTICFFPLNRLLAFGFLCPCYLLMIQSECTHRKVSFTEQKVDYNIIYHKQELSGCLFMALFSAYQVIHTCCKQNEPLQRSLNYFCGNESLKYFIDGKVDMKLSD